MTVLVVVEHDRGKLAPASLEALAAARTIDADVAAITLGAAADGAAGELAAYGATTVQQVHHELLADYCVVPETQSGNTHVFAQCTIRIPNRDGLGEALKSRGIPTAVYYPKCLHEQPVFASLGYQLGSFPEAEKASRAVISLPMHPFLAESEQERVVQAVRECV